MRRAEDVESKDVPGSVHHEGCSRLRLISSVQGAFVKMDDFMKLGLEGKEFGP